jgi:protein phosphatase
MSEMLQFAYKQLTDCGKTRLINEDYVGCYIPNSKPELNLAGSLFLVADGVGGAASGRKASKIAVHDILQKYFENSITDPIMQLQTSIEKTNKKLFDLSLNSEEQGTYATTIVAALIHKKNLIVCSVGDSRAYLIRNQHIKQITSDHTLVNHLLRKGVITPEEAKTHPRRNVITRSLGVKDNIPIDRFKIDLQINDNIFLCTDGVTRYIQDDEMVQIIGTDELGNAAQSFVDLANERGGKDNISVCIIHITGEEIGE